LSCFAIGVILPGHIPAARGPVVDAKLHELSITDANVDPNLPPYEVMPDDEEVVVVLLEAYEDMYPVAVFSSMEQARETFEGSNLRVSYQRVSFDPRDLDLEKLRRDA